MRCSCLADRRGELISLKNFSPTFDLALPQHRLVGLALVPPKRGAIGDQRIHAGFAVHVFVDQLNGATEQFASLLICGGGLASPEPRRWCR